MEPKFTLRTVGALLLFAIGFGCPVLAMYRGHQSNVAVRK